MVETSQSKAENESGENRSSLRPSMVEAETSEENRRDGENSAIGDTVGTGYRLFGRVVLSLAVAPLLLLHIVFQSK